MFIDPKEELIQALLNNANISDEAYQILVHMVEESIEQ